MRNRRSWTALTLLVLLLVACGGPRRVLGPPTLSMQEVEALDGRYVARVRLDSPASMPVTLEHFDWTLNLDGVQVARGMQKLSQSLPPVSGDVVRVDLGAIEALPQFAALTTDSSLAYVLEGELKYSAPNVRFPLRYEGRLRATPGKPGSYR
ncbi:MAG: hypothetical protein IT479_07980 [Xanthomonadales bacterium]|nr:hypothetical protein [Xanthomonadales bacterium]MCC6593199.1 hypothetical protein [Xanthomonadales bacterium]MCE7930701.1 hypothetical protein [Xanthomonadales bacterium PRO6]